MTQTLDEEAVESQLGSPEENLPSLPSAEFITGEAGTGKTWLVKERARRYPGHVLCATTGIAAVNLGEGVTTINSLLKYFDTASLRDSWTQGNLERIVMGLARSGVRQIVLDEVSMLDGEQLTIITATIDSVNERLVAAGEATIGLTLTGDYCLGLDTEVMLADGKICRASEIKEGMQVMGPDSFPRNVLRTKLGEGLLYKVNQTNGEAYIVNALHKLVLKTFPG